jgi:hypothetical protein
MNAKFMKLEFLQNVRDDFRQEGENSRFGVALSEMHFRGTRY